jgi:hypothetical protein
MAIQMNDLLAFNNVETTDPIVAVTKLPFFKQPAFIPNVSYVNGFEQYIRGVGGRGSQVIIRELGKGTATTVKATAAGAFDYTHAETADTVVVVQLDDVIKQSEKIYEAVDVARQSADGARKAEIVLNSLLDAAQVKITAYLETAAQAKTAAAITDAAALKAALISDYTTKFDYNPTTLQVSRATLGLLYQLLTADGFTPNPNETVMRTGVLGTILGMNVIVNENLDSKTAYVMYDHTKFSVFPVLEKLSIVPAIDFDGSYARGLMLLGGYGPNKTKNNGSWAVKHVLPSGS